MEFTGNAEIDSIRLHKNLNPSRELRVLMMFLDPPSPPPMNLSTSKRNVPFFLENLKRHRVSVLALGSKEEEDRFRRAYGDVCDYIKFINIRGTKVFRLLRHLWLLLTGTSQSKCRVYGKKMQRELDTLVSTREFDVIHCTSSLMGYYDFPEHIPVVGDSHNVEFDLMERILATTREPFMKVYSWVEAKRMKRDELRGCRKFQAMLATTGRDRQVWNRALPDMEVNVIENGVEEMFFEPLSDDELEPASMVFVGKLDYYPNHHGMKYFIDEIFPLILSRKPGAKVYVVGANPMKDVLARSSDHVVVTGFVDDIRPYVARSKVFIIPLLMGGGIRGKALEAMAMRRPIVSTTVGIEGISLLDKESALIADTPGAFASAVVRLIDSPEERKYLVDNAFKTVTKRYDWTVKGEQLNEVYQDVVNRHRSITPVSQLQIP